jgi:hypothetical protein
MSSYERIPGGEKTAKSGLAWNRDELAKVLKLYLKLKGEKIHENNIDIQNLANSMERSVRSTEAQMLMFRNLEREGDYSHGNMNKICKKLWEERMNENQKTDAGVPEEQLFPNAFFSWSGSSDGAVKRPFEAEEKRLIGPIKTRVTERLNRWGECIVSGLAAPRSIFLIGGPGNGKSDAVEGTVRKLGSLMGCSAEVEEHFRSEFAKYLDQGILPRKVSLKKKIGNFDGLQLVQDATVRDSGRPGKSPQELLLEDLEQIVINPTSNELYICCVNRGVLAEAITIAASGPYQDNTVRFLNQISLAVTSHPDSVEAWPLAEYHDVGIWPMDVESLVDPALYEGTDTPGERIFSHIVDDAKWKACGGCEAKDHCPFRSNQGMLSIPKVRTALLELLHAYELVSGKRWNFRELFGLVSAMMIGSEKEYRGLTPCEWVREQVEVATGDGKRNAAYRASFNLVSKLYTHALFPRWPKLGGLRNEFAQKLKATGNTFDGQREIVQGFLSSLFQRIPDNTSTISTMLNGPLGESLDPVGYNGSKAINEAGDICMDEVEDLFSHSVSLGLKKINRYLVGPEKILFNFLEHGEDFLEAAGSIKKNNTQVAKRMHSAMRIFAARLFKRSIGVRKGIYQYADEIALYKQTLHNPQEMVRLRRAFEKLINHGSSFQASLVTTFGQPEPSLPRNSLLRGPLIPVKSIPLENDEGRPRRPHHYFKVGSRAIPLTFPLFYALHHSSKGLTSSSLPEEIFALLDSTKSCVLGEVVRDVERTDQYDIIIGGLNEVIKYDDMSGFYVEQIERN